MNIAIDVSPLQTGHKIRGTGFYLTHLKNALLEYFPKNIYHFFSPEHPFPKSVDIVHYPYFDPFFLTLPFWKKNKTVVTVHDLTPLVFPQDFPSGKKGAVKWQIQKRNLRQVDAIITDSHSSKKDIEKFCSIPGDKISVVYLAAGEHFKKISKEKAKETLEKYHLPQEFVLYVGDATANKNLTRLLEAIKKTDLPLIMVGKTLGEEVRDKTNTWNRSLIEAKRLIEENKKVMVLGFVSDEELVALYNAATFFVMPSLYEGFGLPILEAMACGCPVITTKEGSLPEIVDECAYFVDAYDIDDIASGVQNLWKDKKLQHELSEKGLAQAKKFTWEKCARETMHVYEEVFNNQ